MSKHPLKIIAGTLFGAGYLPKAPGTWGSLFTLPLIYFTALDNGTPGIVLLLILFCVLSLWLSSASVEKFGDDPPQFVLDESAGQSVVFLVTGFGNGWQADLLILAAGFIFFRFFDIKKPLGIDALQNLDGKFGILADDLLAGVYALILLETVQFAIELSV